MKRRCGFLDCLPAYNFNTGAGEYITDKQGKKMITDTRQLGSTLMTTMLREVEDFCDPTIKESWSLKPHQQVLTTATTTKTITTTAANSVKIITFPPLFLLPF